MEDDDEFGDLYTDVLTASFQSQQQQPPAPAPQDEAAAPRAAAGAGPTTRPIDLNNNSDDEEILYGAPNPSSNPNFTAPNSVITGNEKTLAPLQDVQSGSKLPEFNLNFNQKAGKLENLSEINESDLIVRVLEKSEDMKLPKVGFQDSNFMDDDNIDFVVEERDDKDDILIEKDQNLGEKNAENLKDGSGNVENFEPLIPGVSIPGVSGGGGNGGDGNLEDDWDSDDSEDDLQIVLNDNTHGPMGMERMGDDEDDEDGEPLVIVADNDGPSHPPMIMEEQEWGDEGGPAVNGERKEINDALKVNGAPGGVAAKVGYNNHGYHHPYHSQYKYVRPGAAPMPGAPLLGPGGAPGQVRPPVNVGPVGGRGRGDWRPTGMKGGYGMSGWGGSAPGRGFGIGLEFTLPTHKTIFEVDIDGFEEKPWRLPGIDVTDFFNFGLNEESWKDYCKQLEQLRLESTMQGRIRVYESGRTEQEYDPDLPPELAAAAGIQDIPSENVNHGKTDGTSTDPTRGSIRMRPPLPTGRPIQVETGSGDRLPSIDTRPPRQRDSDAIIEIVCQDEDQYSGNDKNEVQLGNNSSIEDFRGDAKGSPLQEDSDGFQHSYKSHKQDLSTRRSQFMNPVGDHLTKGDGVGPFPSEAPGQFVSGSRGHTSAHGSKTNVVQHEEREKKGSAHEGSPDISPSGDSRDRLQVDNQKEESFESVDHRHSPVPPSPTTDRPAQEQDMEDRDDIRDQPVGADTNSEAEREEMALDARADSEAMNDEFLHSKKQKLSLRREQSSPQETDGGEDSKAGRSSENSKAQSGSSRDYRKLRDDVEEEVVQDGRPMRMDNAKKAVARDEDRGRRRVYNEKEAEKHRGVVKGREDSYSRKGIDSSSAHYIDRRREREYSEAVWQRRDEDLPGRRTKVEEPRKRELIDETGSRHRSKVREFDGSDREERHLHRKQLESITLRPDYDKDMGARQRDRDELKRYDTLDDRHNKRRKEETKLSREHADKEESFHPHGENMVRRKRERDDTSDHRKRDELLRLRDDEQHYIRHKEDGVFQRERTDRQREREEWYRLKQSQEEALSKREREEIRGGMRAGRVAEEKAWAGHSRGKDENRNSDQHLKDVRHADHIRRRDRAENESPSRLRTREDERRARPDRVSAREDRAPHAPDNSRVNEKRHKEYLKKGKEFEGDHNSQIASNMNEDELNGRRNEMMSLKRKFEQGTNENKVHRNRQSSRKQQEEASSDDEQQDSKKGRSKLERWTSHKERDFSIDAKSSSLNMKDNDVHKSSGTSLANKNPDEALKAVEDNQQPAANNKNGGGPEINNVETKHMEDKHLETVEKLKKRSERFKLPMPSEKEAPVSKKAEGDPISSVQSEIPPDSEVKPERPARRRRWTSN